MPKDWPAVSRIFSQGIATGNATFETEVPEWEEWDVAHLPDCRLIILLENNLLGWAALSPISSRCVYGGVAEVSIYIDENFQGMGLGKKLLNELIHQSESSGIWTLQAGIFPENNASILLHQSCGFRIVGRRERIGQMKGTWRDVILLERRSKIL